MKTFDQPLTPVRTSPPEEKGSDRFFQSVFGTGPMPDEIKRPTENDPERSYRSQAHKAEQDYFELEERIKTLENQSTHLLYFVHFMYENFPELVRKIIPANVSINLQVKKTTDYSEPVANKNQYPKYHPVKTESVITKREMEVLNLLAKGLCAKEIARELFISEATVITHKKNLKEKFDAKNTVELISKIASLVH
jgi:DNA-binding CsgD family transcriptional regulator